jgi:hypothetical protein
MMAFSPELFLQQQQQPPVLPQVLEVELPYHMRVRLVPIGAGARLSWFLLR